MDVFLLTPYWSGIQQAIKPDSFKSSFGFMTRWNLLVMVYTGELEIASYSLFFNRFGALFTRMWYIFTTLSTKEIMKKAVVSTL